MKYFESSCIVDDEGRLPGVLGPRVREVLKQLKGKAIHFIIEDQKQYSTSPQRQYYFGVIVTAFQNYFAAQGQWYDKDTLHEQMMTEIGNFWLEEPNPFNETISKKRRSYNSLSTIEAEEYHTKCRVWAAERLFDIPEPNEVES